MDIDRLVLAIVQPKDAEAITRALNQADLAVTHISSVGGFLGTHNVTLLIGLPSNDVERALELLRTHCHRRTVPANVPGREVEPHQSGFAPPTAVGSATVFVLPVARYLRLEGDHLSVDSTPQSVEPGTMQLVLVIVSNEPSGELLKRLTNWSYRATRFSTIGGFSHRENATLLIGARAERVNSILDQIRQVCAAAPMNNSAATIFVLDIAQHARLW
ncbi:MAG: cyclic-di-AMP receptor [Chloroflexi bacterium]|nr:cyclic-di-AMP receptor [Chloroflexota bacterium]